MDRWYLETIAVKHIQCGQRKLHGNVRPNAQFTSTAAIKTKENQKKKENFVLTLPIHLVWVFWDGVYGANKDK